MPQQNKQVEFSHYSSVQDDMARLQSDTISVAGSVQTRSATIKLGTQYPARVISLNPGPPQGRLQKTLTGTTFSTTASDTVADLCGGDKTFGIQYTPAYNVLEAQPVTVENGQVFVNGDANAFIETRTLINTDTQTIRLYRYTGSIPTESTMGTVDVDVSGNDTIGEADNDEFAGETISVPTQLTAAEWQNELVTDYTTFANDGGNIVDNGDVVDVTVPSGYTVKCYTVGTGDSSISAPSSTFATDPGSGGGSGSGGGGSNDSGSDNVNPSSDQKSLVWKSATVSGSKDERPEVTFKNTDSSGKLSIEKVRYQFYSLDSQGGSGGGGRGTKPPQSVTITDKTSTGGSGDTTDAINYIAPYSDVSNKINKIDSSSERTFEFTFYPNTGASGSPFNVDTNDFFIITIEYTVNGKTKTGTYFIGVSG